MVPELLRPRKARVNEKAEARFAQALRLGKFQLGNRDARVAGNKAVAPGIDAHEQIGFADLAQAGMQRLIRLRRKVLHPDRAETGIEQGALKRLAMLRKIQRGARNEYGQWHMYG